MKDDYGFFCDLEIGDPNSQIEFYVVKTRIQYEVRRKFIVPNKLSDSCDSIQKDAQLSNKNQTNSAQDILYCLIVLVITVLCFLLLKSLPETYV